MAPDELKSFLQDIVGNDLRYLSTMMWGPPGIGKSAVVAQVAESNDMGLIDLRLSQLAPTDLRGLPVPEDEVARWRPPEFLPQEGTGILFLDELNMAAPTLQGIAQQLILDRRVGSYEVPEGWFIWAAGNRKEDRASVYEMPAPLSNRFIHLDVQPDYDAFRRYALRNDFHEQIQAFLAFRPDLLFRLGEDANAFPSPRTWEMASELHTAGLDIAPAVGNGVAGEFKTFIDIYTTLPDYELIMEGERDDIEFPEEASKKYAVTMGLSTRVSTADETVRCFKWLLDKGTDDFVQLFANNAFAQMRQEGEMGNLARRIQEVPELKSFAEEMQQLSADLAT